jgi:hypothetical protein
MTDRRTVLTDERLGRFLRTRSTAADANLLDDIVRSAETTAQEWPWFRLRPAALAPAAPRGMRAAAIGAVVVIALTIGAGLLVRSNVGDVDPTPAASPSLASWTGPVRADAATLPVVAMVEMPELEVHGLPESRDSDLPWADIVDVQYRPAGDGLQSRVDIVLAARPPRAETLPADEVISYGFVIDTSADGTPDYEVGIATDAHDGGDFNVWVTDLATGVTDLNAAPPYGYPVEFWHPSEPKPPRHEEFARTMLFTFLPGSDPVGFDSSSRIYAWSLVTRGGEVVAWDYAPDAAWARLPDK